MGTKRLKNDWNCTYCGTRGNIADLKERLFIFETKMGYVCECPKCGMEQLLNNK